MDKKWSSPKEYLSQIKNVDQKINTKLDCISSLWDKATKVNKNLKIDLVQEGSSFDTADIINKIIDYENEVNDMINELIDLQRTLQKEIESLDNQLFVSVLLHRYNMSMSLMEISNELNYQESYIRKVHGWALESFKEKYPEKFN